MAKIVVQYERDDFEIGADDNRLFVPVGEIEAEDGSNLYFRVGGIWHGMTGFASGNWHFAPVEGVTVK